MALFVIFASIVFFVCSGILGLIAWTNISNNMEGIWVDAECTFYDYELQKSSHKVTPNRKLRLLFNYTHNKRKFKNIAHDSLMGVRFYGPRAVGVPCKIKIKRTDPGHIIGMNWLCSIAFACIALFCFVGAVLCILSLF